MLFSIHSVCMVIALLSYFKIKKQKLENIEIQHKKREEKLSRGRAAKDVSLVWVCYMYYIHYVSLCISTAHGELHSTTRVQRPWARRQSFPCAQRTAKTARALARLRRNWCKIGRRPQPLARGNANISRAANDKILAATPFIGVRR